MKGVGHRLRVNSSKDEYFEESVEETAKAFKISGYSYQETKKELMKFKHEDPLELIKKKKKVRNKPHKGVRSFYISKYDPRMPHPRKLITRNYHHLEIIFTCRIFFQERIWWVEQGDNLTFLKYFPQVFNSQVVGQSMGMGGGTAPTTALLSSLKVNVMSAAIWWKPPPYILHILNDDLQSTAEMCIFLPPRKIS